MKKSIVYSLLFVSILQSCGTSSNVTSNFSIQKRKYTKGWNLNDLFHGKQNEENRETEIQVKVVKLVENDQESTSIRSKPEENLFAESTTIEIAEAKIEETKEDNQSIQKLDALEKDISPPISLKIENDQTAESREKNSDLNDEQNEKKIDYLFRIFFIVGFSLALLACILALVQFTAEFALGLLLLLVLVDIASLVIVTILLVKRYKNKGKYKESSLIVILTEILFGLVSFLSIVFFKAYSAF